VGNRRRQVLAHPGADVLPELFFFCGKREIHGLSSPVQAIKGWTRFLARSCG
jgi:hypothetical protein